MTDHGHPAGTTRRTLVAVPDLPEVSRPSIGVPVRELSDGPACQMGVCEDHDTRASFLMPEEQADGSFVYKQVCTFHRTHWWEGTKLHPTKRPPSYLLAPMRRA